ncbi:hypothetical protein [Aeromonas hydrophila]|uniref:hypothetical protein n=1 Tax=Aeromonas hydrophila TaxID=644 RepID=UPI003D26229C
MITVGPAIEGYVVSPIQSHHLGIPPEHPINLTNAELAQRLIDLLDALPPLYVEIVKEAAQRLIDMGD